MFGASAPTWSVGDAYTGTVGYRFDASTGYMICERNTVDLALSLGAPFPSNMTILVQQERKWDKQNANKA